MGELPGAGWKSIGLDRSRCSLPNPKLLWRLRSWWDWRSGVSDRLYKIQECNRWYDPREHRRPPTVPSPQRAIRLQPKEEKSERVLPWWKSRSVHVGVGGVQGVRGIQGVPREGGG